MHSVLAVLPSTGGELWLGGIVASGLVSVLQENGISPILAAVSKPPIAMDASLKFLIAFKARKHFVRSSPQRRWESHGLLQKRCSRIKSVGSLMVCLHLRSDG